MFALHVKFEKSLGVMVVGYTLHRNYVVELGDKYAMVEDVETEALEVAKKI